MTDFNELMKQAQQVKDKMERARRELDAKVVIGESGAGAVKVRMSGGRDVIAVEIDDVLLREEKEIVEDLIRAAINDALRKIERESRQAMRDMMGLPEGFGFPFQVGP